MYSVLFTDAQTNKQIGTCIELNQIMNEKEKKGREEKRQMFIELNWVLMTFVLVSQLSLLLKNKKKRKVRSFSH